MKKIIQKYLAKITPRTSGDERLAIMHSLYNALKKKGYDHKIVRAMIAVVIKDKIMKIKDKLEVI